jgi:prepilin-type N-terminal cleavage/methylation domain-containing protein
MRRPQPQRAGFTLIELLVVVTIIIVLTGLITAGVFRYLDTQMWANTQYKIGAIQQVLNAQWKKVIEDADKETPPSSVLTFASSDKGRAKVIWRKVRLAEAFPMSAAEISSSDLYNVNLPSIGALVPSDRRKYLASYQKELSSATISGNLFLQSSSCLYLALRRARTGTEVDIEKLARDTNGDGVKELVDDWGNPIAFYRFPWNNTKLQQANPAPANSKSTRYADPLDPDGKLMSAAFSYRPYYENRGLSSGQTGLTCFHYVSSTAGQVPALYTVPVLVSAGEDGNFGLVTGTMDTHRAMQVDSSNSAAEDDNLYSFDFRLGAGEAQ